VEALRKLLALFADAETPGLWQGDCKKPQGRWEEVFTANAVAAARKCFFIEKK